MGVISVGFGNFVTRERVTAIISSESSPIKRAIQDAKKESTLIDATQEHKTKSVLFMDDGRLVVSGLGAETLAKRMDSSVSEVTDADMG